MNRILIIFIAITRNWLRSRSGVFFSLLFPLMLLLVFGSVFGGGGGGAYSLQIQNQDLQPNGTATSLSSTFIHALNETKTLSIKEIPASADPKEFVKNATQFFGGRQRLLLIPQGFQSNLLNGTTKVRLNVTYTTTLYFLQNFGQGLSEAQKQGIAQGLTDLNSTLSRLSSNSTSLIYISESDDAGGQIVKGIITSIANSFNYRVIGAQPIINLSIESLAVRTLHPIDYYVPGYIGAFIMTNGIIGLTNIATEFKRRGILKRLSATPLSRFEWIAGNILSQTLFAVTLTALMILVGMLVFNVSVVIDVYSAALIFVGAILFSGIGMLLAGLVKDQEAANGIGNAVAFPMMFLSGSFWPVDIMPPFMQSIARVLPLTYFSDGLRASLILQNSSMALFNLGVVAALAVLFITLGSIFTQWREK
jgi:ABC-2 type transport system permease protein